LVLVGADLPTIESVDLSRAFEALTHGALAVSPSQDGGFSILGLRRNAVDDLPCMFANVSWFSRRVLSGMVANLHAARVSFSFLRSVTDLDRWRDVIRLLAARAWSALGAAALRVLTALFTVPIRSVSTIFRSDLRRRFACALFLPAPPLA
jgi:glycosyltransferase A (GT-A) superfamily protein (DUF2064 family)